MGQHNLTAALALIVVVLAGQSARAEDDPRVIAAEAKIRTHDFAGAVALLSDSALAQNAEALFTLASLYRAGRGVDRDDVRAFDLTTSAATLGLPDAMYSLGRLFLDGIGTQADTDLAKSWLERAADQGHASAAALLVSIATTPPEPAAPAVIETVAEPPSPSDLSKSLGWTAMIEGARRNSVPVVTAAITGGADLNATDRGGRTALSHAAEMGSFDAARVLIEAGAAIDMADALGKSPLAYAAAGLGSELAILLTQKGAAPLSTGQDGVTALERAFIAGNCDAAATMLEKIGKLDFDSHRTANMAGLAARSCDVRAIERLLPLMPDRDLTDAEGRTLVWHAAAGGNAGTLAYLLRQGGDLSNSDTKGVTPLLAALANRQAETIHVLLDAGAPIDAETNAGNTPLLLAARDNLTDILTLMIAAGADMDHKSQLGETALMAAARAGNAEAVKVLLEAGADRTIRNARRERAIDIAQTAGHPELAPLLE